MSALLFQLPNLRLPVRLLLLLLPRLLLLLLQWLQHLPALHLWLQALFSVQRNCVSGRLHLGQWQLQGLLHLLFDLQSRQHHPLHRLLQRHGTRQWSLSALSPQLSHLPRLSLHSLYQRPGRQLFWLLCRQVRSFLRDLSKRSTFSLSLLPVWLNSRQRKV